MGGELRGNILEFFEKIQQYYGCKTDITQGLYSRYDDLDASLTTWNLSAFELVRSAYRKKGDCFMLEGNGMYLEISARMLVDFKQPGRNSFEFVELYGDSVYRITKVRFHSRY
jgi:hypothetical protein